MACVALIGRAAALEILEGARIPCAPILSVPEAKAHPHMIERRTVRSQVAELGLLTRKLRTAALTDVLTELPNRVLLAAHLDAALGRGGEVVLCGVAGLGERGDDCGFGTAGELGVGEKFRDGGERFVVHAAEAEKALRGGETVVFIACVEPGKKVADEFFGRAFERTGFVPLRGERERGCAGSAAEELGKRRAEFGVGQAAIAAL